MSARVAPDWERVEVLYRAGNRSVREIAAEFKISHTAIQKRAKAQSWTRDLSHRVQAMAAAKVVATTVATEVARVGGTAGAATKLTEAMTLEVESTVLARVKLAHRADIAKARALVQSLQEELRAVTDSRALLEGLAELARDPEAMGSDRQAELIRRLAGVGGRADIALKLLNAMRLSLEMERTAHGLDKHDQPPPQSSLSEWFRAMQSRPLQVVQHVPAEEDTP